MKRTITATFNITTPMFLGSADPVQADTLFRVGSFRGVLRWWWRALNYPQFYVDALENQQAALKELGIAETRLFGSSDDGQGAVLMRLVDAQSLDLVEAPGRLMNGGHVVGPGACYLAGQGLIVAFGDEKGTLKRSCITPDQSVTIAMLVKEKESATASEVDSLIRAVKALGLLGGVGSHLRRGWGSVSLTNLEVEGFEDGIIAAPFEAPTNPEAYKAAIAEIFSAIPYANAERLPPFTAFGPKSRIDILCRPSGNPLSVLDNVGKAMQRYRSWGHNGMVDGVASEENFKDDHDWLRGREPGSPPLPANFVPRRTVFGLPHNYGQEASVEPAGELDRRASPLLLHVHKLRGDQDRYIAVSTILPAKFLPDHGGDVDRVTTSGVLNAGDHPANIDWDVLNTFIDGNGPLTPPPGTLLTPYFPNRDRVLP